MNYDRSLYMNAEGGADDQWQRLDLPADASLGVPTDGALPADTQHIAVGGRILYYIRGMDRTLWWVDLGHIDSGVRRGGRPHALAELAGTEDNTLDFPFLYALNDDKTLWFNSSGGVDSQWSRVGQPYMAQKIAATQKAVYALLEDRTLMRNDRFGVDGAWRMIDRPHAARDISAATISPDLREDVLYALNDDFTLWRGEVS